MPARPPRRHGLDGAIHHRLDRFAAIARLPVPAEPPQMSLLFPQTVRLRAIRQLNSCRVEVGCRQRASWASMPLISSGPSQRQSWQCRRFTGAALVAPEDAAPSH